MPVDLFRTRGFVPAAATDVPDFRSVHVRRGRCPFPGQVPIPGHLGNSSWRWSFFSKILTGSVSHLNGWSCEVLSPCDRRGIYATKKKISQKFKKHFFLFSWNASEPVLLCTSTFHSYCPGLGTQRNQSISEMTIIITWSASAKLATFFSWLLLCDMACPVQPPAFFLSWVLLLGFGKSIKKK